MRHHPMLCLLTAALVPVGLACANETQPQAVHSGTVIPIDSSTAGAAGNAATDATMGTGGSGGSGTQIGTPELPPMNEADPPEVPALDASTPDDDDEDDDDESSPDAASEEEEDDEDDHEWEEAEDDEAP